MQWYYAKDGTQLGPVDDTELRRLARSGEITQDDLVWNATLGDQWQPASSFSFLFFHPVDLQPPAIPAVVAAPAAPVCLGTTPNRDLIRMARESLKGKWAMAVLASLVYLGIFASIGLIASFFSPHPAPHQTSVPTAVSSQSSSLHLIGITFQILQFLITGPMTMGFCCFFLGRARHSEISFTDLFKGFRVFWKAVGLYLLMGLFSFFWMILALLPMLALIIWAQMHHLRNDLVATSVIVLLGILGGVGAMVKIIGYWMSYLVLADHPSTGPLSAIRKSKVMMDGRKWKLVCLQLHFLGWWLLGLLTCGIGFLWLIPYIQTANAYFYLDVKDRSALPKS